MKRAALGITLLLSSASVIAQQQPVTKIHTALNHLTVIEMSEPVTMAAAGSDAFEIKRHGNRVFIEPLRANVDTNLFLWTAHEEKVYELEPAGEVNAMDVLIAPKPQLKPSVSASELHDSDIRKIADMVMTKALLQTQQISQRNTKPVHNGVNIRIEAVASAKDALYIRYSVINSGKTPYRVPDPAVEQLRPAQPPFSMRSYLNAQLSEKALQKMGNYQATGVPIASCEIAQRDVAPGSAVTGVVAIRVSSPDPRLYRLIFGRDGDRPIAAAVVL
jgi:hypothetical protein